jgi:hypothetical protein
MIAIHIGSPIKSHLALEPLYVSARVPQYKGASGWGSNLPKPRASDDVALL